MFASAILGPTWLTTVMEQTLCAVDDDDQEEDDDHDDHDDHKIK